MSDTKHSAPLIKNQDTLRRRAWVERALAGVRGRSSTTEDAPIDESVSPKPKLFVVGSNRAR